MKVSSVALFAYLAFAPFVVVSGRRLGATSNSISSTTSTTTNNNNAQDAKLPPMEKITSMASTAIRLATEENRRHLQDISVSDKMVYKGELESMVKAVKIQLAGDGRHLQSNLSASSQTCLSDTDWMLDYNPSLSDATSDYINSLEMAPSGSSYIAYFSDALREDLRLECSRAGGMFDVNYGSLSCDLTGVGSISLLEYVSCLPSTQECRSKKNYEFLKWSLESEGFTNCRAPTRPQQPVLSPTPYPSYEKPVLSPTPYPSYNNNYNEGYYNGSGNSTAGGGANIFVGMNGSGGSGGINNNLLYVIIAAGVVFLLTVVIVAVFVCRRNKARRGEESPKPKIAQGTAVQGNVVPGTVVSGTVVPGTVVPGTVVPGTVVEKLQTVDIY